MLKMFNRSKMNKNIFKISAELLRSIESYINEHYIQEEPFADCEADYFLDESVLEMAQYRRVEKRPRASLQPRSSWREKLEEKTRGYASEVCEPVAEPKFDLLEPLLDLVELLDETDAGFSETLLKLIDKSGKKDSAIYKKANVDRKLFSKIRTNPAYRPSKVTAIAFALALELDLEETQEFIGRAGYTLTHSSKFDIIIEYFILHGNYDIFEINAVLFRYDQPLIGAE